MVRFFTELEVCVTLSWDDVIYHRFYRHIMRLSKHGTMASSYTEEQRQLSDFLSKQYHLKHTLGYSHFCIYEYKHAITEKSLQISLKWIGY